MDPFVTESPIQRPPYLQTVASNIPLFFSLLSSLRSFSTSFLLTGGIMAYTAATHKVALVIAVCVVLLHTSMGQQPEPVLDCGNSCNSNCTQRCNDKADAEYGKCNTMLEFYDNCSKNCTSHCNGNSFARGSCTMGSCSPNNCGNPCARTCCESCSNTAPDLFSRCMSSRGMIMISCMSSCMDVCVPNCNSGSVPWTP